MIGSINNILVKLRQIHKNEKIVFTNGVFDVLHRGHVDYLQKAHDKGDILVVGINSDESVKRLKGPERPINSEEDRAFVVDGLGAVDYVFLFPEDTPHNSILKIMPDILVKGGDYDAFEENESSPKYIIGSKEVKKNGGSVVTIPFVSGRSSTNIINKIKKNLDYEKKHCTK